MEKPSPLFTKLIVPTPPMSVVPSSPEPAQASQIPPQPQTNPSSPSSSPLPLPPSPPSSCGSRSPPSTPGSQNPPTPQSPESPSSSSACVNVAPKNLAFSIENILKPDFGSKPIQRLTFSPLASPEALRTPPNSPELRVDSPVDLSQKSNSITNSTTRSSTDSPNSLPRSLSSPSSGDESAKCKNSAPNFNILNKGSTQSSSNLRTRYPENPEQLANPSVPDGNQWPAWVFCTRYSDRPSSGPRSRRMKRSDRSPEEKRPRTAFTTEQLSRLKKEFDNGRYLDEKRRKELAKELGLNESQIKIWFQNKRAKIKKTTATQRSTLAQHLMAQGLYNHSTVPLDEDDPFP